MAFSSFILRNGLISVPWKTTAEKKLLLAPRFSLTDSDGL